MAQTSLDIVAMVTGLGGGLALFIYGMRKMTEALKTVAGPKLKDVLAVMTTNRFTGALSGALITAVIQSSSVTTVMVVGFVSAGLITFTQSVGVIMGANIGTTVTAQIIAFQVTEYSLVMIGVGFLTEVLARSQRVRHYGMALMGLGLLFFGMELMSNAAAPLRSYPPFLEVMQDMRSPIMGILADFVFTAIVQSSSATTGIVIVLGAQGFISLEAGIAIVLGANIGTCVTAALSALGHPREAVKAAAVHILFNLIGVLIWVWFIPYFADLVRAVSPAADHLAGTERLAADVPRQIANAHTLFNLTNLVLFIGFAGTLAAFIEKTVPKARRAPPGEGQPQHLDALYLDQPALALDRVKLELGRLAGLTGRMVGAALPATLAGGDSALNALRESDDDVDELHEAILTYLGELSLGDLVEPLPSRIQEYIGVANYLENVGDWVESGFVPLGYKRLELGVQFGDDTRAHLERLAGQAVHDFEMAIVSFIDEDLDAAQAVVKSKESFNQLADTARAHLSGGLSRARENGLDEYRLAVDVVENLKRIHTLARRISRVSLVACGQQGDKTVSD